MQTPSPIDRAFTLYQAGHVPQSLALVQQILMAQPDRVEALYLLGLILRREKKNGMAVAPLQRAVRLDPGMVEGWYNLAVVLEEDSRPDEEVIHALEQATACKPDFAQALFRLAVLLIRQHRYEEAVTGLSVAARSEPGEGWLHLALAHALTEAGQPDLAAARARVAVALDPANPDGHALLGRVMHQARRMDAATGHLRRALCIAPDHLSACDVMAKVVFAQQRWRDSLEWSFRAVPSHFGTLRRVALPPLPCEAILDRIDAAIPPDIDRDGATVYLHVRTGMIGHVFIEPSAVLSCFDRPQERVIMLGHPRATFPKINPCIFDIGMRGVTYVETTDMATLGLSWRNCGIFERGSTGYLLMDHHYPVREAFRNLLAGRERVRPSLLPEEEERGRMVARRMGIPDDAPVVVVHLRESGFHAHIENQFSYRNNTPSHYFPALAYLVRRGYFVVRIGDASMTPLPGFGPQVIDTPFSPHYDPIVEPYFINRCAFMVSSLSGPQEVARGLKKPVLTVNIPMCSIDAAEAPGLVAFKKYFDTSGPCPRPMHMQEILDRNLHDTYSGLELARRKVRLEELTPHEILAITREMVTLMERGGEAPFSPAQAEFRRIAEAENRRAGQDWSRIQRNLDWFGYAAPLTRVSDEYCFYNPEFVGV